jgi:menaquinol-cytochrome c reductase cytochrome b/c subunit
MVLLVLLPFYDRNPERRPERRPIAMTALGLTIIAMAYLTYVGANTGSPTDIEQAIQGVKAKAASGAPNQITPAQFETLKGGKEVVAGSGCLACHKIGENGGTLGPNLSHIGARIPRNGILRSLRAGPGIMPSFETLPPRKQKEIADYLSSLH